MDTVQLTRRSLVFFTLCTGTAVADLPPASVIGDVFRGAVSTTIAIEPAVGGSSVLGYAYSPAGALAASKNVGIQSGAYTRGINLGIGKTMAALKATNPIDKAAVASAAVKCVRSTPVCAASAAITVAGALFLYFNGNGYSVDPATSLILKSVPVKPGVPACDTGDSQYQYNATTWFYYHQFPNTTECAAPGVVAALCPKGSQYDAICKTISTSPQPPQPVDEAAAEADLATKPFSDPLVKDLADQGHAPAYGPAVMSGPAAVEQPQETSVAPDGTVIKKKTVTDLAYPGDNTVKAQDTGTTEVTKPDGSVATVPIQEAPEVPTTPIGADPATPPAQTDTKTDCDKYPNAVGCLELGPTPTPDEIPSTNVQADFTPVSLGGGSCPAPKTAALHGGTHITVSFEPMCELATSTAPFFISICWLIAAYIFTGSVRT